MRNRIGIAITLVFICLFGGFMLFNPNTHTELFERTIMNQISERGVRVTDDDGLEHVFYENQQVRFYFRKVVMKRTYTMNEKEYYLWHVRLSVWVNREKNLTLNGIALYYKDEHDPRMFVLDQWIPLKVLRQKGFW